MITNISGGPGITVQGGNSNQIYLQPSQPGTAIPTGQLRYNNNMIEVYDGSSWRVASNSYTNISLDVGMIEAIEWARKKMQEEKELEELAKQFPILEDAMRDLEVIKVLVRGKRNSDLAK